MSCTVVNEKGKRRKECKERFHWSGESVCERETEREREKWEREREAERVVGTTIRGCHCIGEKGEREGEGLPRREGETKYDELIALSRSD